jgi:hypothetical protein
MLAADEPSAADGRNQRVFGVEGLKLAFPRSYHRECSKFTRYEERTPCKSLPRSMPTRFKVW